MWRQAAICSPVAHQLRAPFLGVINSYIFDWEIRSRQGGAQVDYHILSESVLCKPPKDLVQLIARIVNSLNACALDFAGDWEDFSTRTPQRFSWRRLWAITDHERLRLRAILDAVVAQLYGLDRTDLAWILRDCDHPVTSVCNKPFSRTLDPKGFWRVDKDRPPELRHTVLSQVAFHELKRVGLKDFLALNDGDGWHLPETLRLADYSLGHDDRARASQPVAEALGPRFLDWQLAQSPAESWAECARHAALIEAIVPARRAADNTAPESDPNDPQSPPDSQMSLF